MNYKLPDKKIAVNAAGSMPTITFRSNQSSTHYHVQVDTPGGWQMVVDTSGLGRPVPIKGGPIQSAADFAGKRLFWDITLASLDATNPTQAVLEISIDQDGTNLVTVDDTHMITGQESYYEFISAM